MSRKEKEKRLGDPADEKKLSNESKQNNNPSD